MRAVVQRVSNARVDIDGATAGSIGRGLLILLGVGHDDSEEQAERLWSKIARLRIFEDAEGKTNLSLADVGGEVLVVSQFTLFANCRRGNTSLSASEARTSANSSPQSPRFVQNPAYTRSACATAARSTSSTRPNARRPSLGSAAATARANASVFPVRLSYTIA